jgi:hypothetical protein
MYVKPKGECPACHAIIQAKVIEENYIRRDICECPECKEHILVCRMPGCYDYALGGKWYDDELCPKCKSIDNIGSVATTLTSVLGVIAMAGSMFKKNDNKDDEK